MATPEGTGLIGSLTPTQEAGLREFWNLLLASTSSIIASAYDIKLSEGSPEQPFVALGKNENKDLDLNAFIATFKAQSSTELPAVDGLKISDETAPASDAAPAPTDDKPAEASPEEALKSGLSRQKISPANFAAVFSRLRALGVQDAEIKSMERILSSMTPEEMCFAVLKMIKQEHPDSLLLRFLRARKWDVGKAYAMLTANMLWRKEAKVDDDVLPNGDLYSLEKSKDETISESERKASADFIKQLQVGKSFLHGFDKTGRPVNYVRVKIHDPKAQSAETLERYILHVIESTRLIVAPPVETGMIVFDMTGFGLNNMDLNPVKFIIKCFEANYPESLGRLLIHNAPWVFSTIWTMIKGLMDPVVREKVIFTKSIKDLEQYIDRAQIPKELGGGEDWTYEYILPQAGVDDVKQDAATRDQLMYERLNLGVQLLSATAAWIEAAKEGGDAAQLPEIKSRRDAIVKDLTANYWKVDPYLRARALIDRTGTLLADGTVVRERMSKAAA